MSSDNVLIRVTGKRGTTLDLEQYETGNGDFSACGFETRSFLLLALYAPDLPGDVDGRAEDVLTEALDAQDDDGWYTAAGWYAAHVDDFVRAFEVRKRHRRVRTGSQEARLRAALDATGWSDEGLLAHAPYAECRAEVTDARWIQHLEVGDVFGTTAYDVWIETDPPPPPYAPRPKRTDAPAPEPDPETIPVRVPVPLRPSGPVDWTWGIVLDPGLEGERRQALEAFLRPFVSEGAWPKARVFGPDAAPARRLAAFQAGDVLLEAEQLEAWRPEADPAERRARLQAALDTPGPRAWGEVVMLLSTWDPASLDDAVARAEAGLARWPHRLRTLPEAWADRPTLAALATHFEGDVAKLLARPDAGRVRSLQTYDAEGVAAHQDALGDLAALGVTGEPDALAAVRGYEGLAALKHLSLEGMGEPLPGGLAALVAAPHLQGLESLSLDRIPLTEADVEALAESPWPLRRLRLEDANLTSAAAEPLARLLARGRMAGLALRYNELESEGLARLLEAGEGLASLTFLDLSQNDVDDAGARALAACPHLGALQTLLVDDQPLGSAGVAALLGASHLGALGTLAASDCEADLAEILAAIPGPAAPPLRVLGLRNLESPEGTPVDWGRATFLARVQTLDLDGLHGDQYAGLLACPHLGALEVLRLGTYFVPEAGVEALLGAAAPPRLHYLEMEDLTFTPEQAAALADSALGKALWGVCLYPHDTSQAVWRALYERGLPLLGDNQLLGTRVPDGEGPGWSISGR